MHPPVSANDAFFASRQARSMPVLSSLTSVRGYPSKLKIYRISGSRFWQVRCFMNGKMYVRSTRVMEKQLATEVAKKFYEELIVKHNLWGEDDVARMDAPRKMAEKIRHTFESVADKAIEQERGRMMRGELSLQSFKSLRSRFKKQIIPFFVEKDIREISHDDISVFMGTLAERGSSSITISQYLQSIRLVFKFALSSLANFVVKG